MPLYWFIDAIPFDERYSRGDYFGRSRLVARLLYLFGIAECDVSLIIRRSFNLWRINRRLRREQKLFDRFVRANRAARGDFV